MKLYEKSLMKDRGIYYSEEVEKKVLLYLPLNEGPSNVQEFFTSYKGADIKVESKLIEWKQLEEGIAPFRVTLAERKMIKSELHRHIPSPREVKWEGRVCKYDNVKLNGKNSNRIV